jgi:hypothetical protein
MKVWWLCLLILMANCSDSVRPPATGNTGQIVPSPQSSVTPQGSNQTEAAKAPEPAPKVPPAFAQVDFRNHTYPTTLGKRSVTLKVNSCRFKNEAFQLFHDPDGADNKFRATTYSHFYFERQHNRFVLRKRQVLPNPQPDTRNYPVRIEIN